MTFRLTLSLSKKHLHKHLLRGFGSTALIGGSLCLTASAPAHAALPPYTCTFGYSSGSTCPNSTPWTLGDKTLTLDSKTLPSFGSGTIKFSWQELGGADGYFNDIWSVGVDFDPNLAVPYTQGNTTFSSISGAFTYMLEVTGTSDWVFSTVDLDSIKKETDAQNGGIVLVAKTLPDSNTSPNGPLVSSNGNNVNPATFQDDYTKISVTDSYSLTAGTSGFILLDSFENSFTQRPAGLIPPVREDVPTPLPLLGAGAAFSFSRRIRRQIRQRFLPVGRV